MLAIDDLFSAKRPKWDGVSTRLDLAVRAGSDGQDRLITECPFHTGAGYASLLKMSK